MLGILEIPSRISTFKPACGGLKFSFTILHEAPVRSLHRTPLLRLGGGSKWHRVEHLLIRATMDDFAHAELMGELTLGMNAGTVLGHGFRARESRAHSTFNLFAVPATPNLRPFLTPSHRFGIDESQVRTAALGRGFGNIQLAVEARQPHRNWCVISIDPRHPSLAEIQRSLTT